MTREGGGGGFFKDGWAELPVLCEDSAGTCVWLEGGEKVVEVMGLGGDDEIEW